MRGSGASRDPCGTPYYVSDTTAPGPGIVLLSGCASVVVAFPGVIESEVLWCGVTLVACRSDRYPCRNCRSFG